MFKAYVCAIIVPQLDEYINKVTGAGGTIVVPKSVIPGVGWHVYCRDIDGNMFAMRQEHSTGEQGERSGREAVN